MKNNIKNQVRYGINIFLAIILIFISISVGQAAVSASRTVDNATVIAGGDINVTVVINNDVTQALSLQEKIPSGWSLTKISDDADTFKQSTNEWVWFTVSNNSVKTVKYKITVPSTASGTYTINGGITANGSTTSLEATTIQVIGQSNSDTITPTTNISGVTQGNTYIDNVTITLSATDNSGGSGVNKTFYTVNGGANTTYSIPFLVSNIGPNTVEYWSIDNAGNVEQINTIDFVINKSSSISPTLSFDFTVDQSSDTINVGDTAQYNITISNTGSTTDIYNIVANQPNNATVNLEKNSVTIDPGNDSVIGLSVNSSMAGTYIVDVKATSQTDANKTSSVSITTNIIAINTPVLNITNFSSVPNTAISSTNPAKLSAYVTKGVSNINLVEFGIVDNNSILGNGTTVILYDNNVSGAQGFYTESWEGSYVTIENMDVSELVSIYTESDNPGFVNVRGTFKSNNGSSGMDSLLSFNQTTGDLSNVTDSAGNPLNIQDGNSTFSPNTTQFVNGNFVQISTSTEYPLYDLAGISSDNNPHIVTNTIPAGKYKVFVLAKDANESEIRWLDIDTIVSTTNSVGSSVGSSGGSGGGGGGGGGGSSSTSTANKTNQTSTINKTAIPTPTNTVIPTTTVQETSTQSTVEQPTDLTKSGGRAPGFEIIIAIGAMAAIYIIRKVK